MNIVHCERYSNMAMIDRVKSGLGLNPVAPHDAGFHAEAASVSLADYGQGSGREDRVASSTRGSQQSAVEFSGSMVQEDGIAADYPSVAEDRSIRVIVPTDFEDACFVGNCVCDQIPVVLDLREVDDALARRILDFTTGVAFSSGCWINELQVSGNVYSVIPEDEVLSPQELVDALRSA